MSGFDIEAAAQFLGNLLLQELLYLGGVRDNVEELKSEVEWMQCFLADADGKQNKNVLIRKWMFDIRDIAMEAEDIIETFILKAAQVKEGEYGFYFISPNCILNNPIRLHNVGLEIDRLTFKISKLTSRLQTYGVRGSYDFQTEHNNMMRKFLAEQRRTYSHDEASYVVGLEDRADRLVQQLQRPQKVVVVHGMGGIGKTTLAKEVLHHQGLQGHFAGVAWAYVSQQFQREIICKDILNQLVPDRRNQTDRLSATELPVMLSNILKQHNYLVVLDDAWTVGDWNLLAHAFPIQDPDFNSKILITTRNPQILSHLDATMVLTFEAKILNGPDSWRLLQSKGHFEEPLPDPMKDVAKKMLDHCDGNPLAIVTLGGVLATKKTLQEWESVFDDLPSHLRGDESYSKVYDVLAIGYHDLLYHMKPCFLHMGNFPEDFRINVDRIYNIWIAEGIVSLKQDQIGGKRSLEDVADYYLNQLVQKGMIQVFDVDVYGRIKTCGLHDLMRDKCLMLMGEESFVQIVDPEPQNTFSDAVASTEKVRRLTVYVGEEADQSVLMAASKGVPSLRSLLFISTCGEDRKEVKCKSIEDLCKSYELLRVLDFEGLVLKGGMPRNVGKLIYLRYLSLKGTNVTELPSSIKKLRSLLILDLRVKKVTIKVPNVLWKITSLRHVFFPEKVLSQEPDAALDQGYEIKSRKKKLILDYLSHLERIDNLDLDRVDEKGLPWLTSITKLSATCKRARNVLEYFLRSRNIKYLNLHVDAGLLNEGCSLLSVSESLRILHVNADREPPTLLTVQANMFPRNLVELGFWYCRITEDPMPVLGELPNLKILHFVLCYRGEYMNCSASSFPELTFLELDGLNSLTNWNVEEGGFPKLKKVGIYFCPLESIPIALPSNVSISCTPDLKNEVDRFHRERGSEVESESSTGEQTYPSTWPQ